ncbi:MAG: AMP-binding protein [Candidatus Cloacimonas sp.]|jgi:amino acid adenylation domain-containing protein|nr:AMP-binding protein [Candidatus Cloacimonas sp.]
MWIQSIVSNFFNIAQRYKNEIAIIEQDNIVYFSQLFNMSYSIADMIINIHDNINSIIAVYLPKSSFAIISDIGILMSGNAFMNLDINAPINRIKNILSEIKPKIIITDIKYNIKLSELNINYYHIIYINDIDINSINNTINYIKDRLSSIIDTDIMCLVNTSGSTGKPKAVALTHKNYIDFYEWATSNFDFKRYDIIGSQSPIFFDHFNFELCLLMIKGVKICIIPESMMAYPIKLLEYIKNKNVSFIFWVPFLLATISNLDLLNNIKLTSLKMVWFAGEVLHPKHINYWMSKNSNVKFVNLYGPTECSVDCTYYQINNLIDSDSIPIGKPCRNTNVIIINDNNQETSYDEKGELIIRGSSLAAGYYNNFDQTRISFVQNPLNNSYPEIVYKTGDIVYKRKDGNIMFVGRKDNQIKHMGYRIELGEIEQAALSISFIKNVCVVYNQQEKEIVMFFESANKLESKELWVHLMQLLPKYMLPTKYIQLEKIPTNPNGKIDRNYLANSIKK